MTSTTHTCDALLADGSGCTQPGTRKYPRSTDVWFCLTHMNYERKPSRPVRVCDVGKEDHLGGATDCQVAATRPVEYWPGHWACEAHYLRYWSDTVPAKRVNHFDWLWKKENALNCRLWMERMSREEGWVLEETILDGWPSWKCAGILKKKRATKKKQPPPEQPQGEASWPSDSSDEEEKKD